MTASAMMMMMCTSVHQETGWVLPRGLPRQCVQECNTITTSVLLFDIRHSDTQLLQLALFSRGTTYAFEIYTAAVNKSTMEKTSIPLQDYRTKYQVHLYAAATCLYTSTQEADTAAVVQNGTGMDMHLLLLPWA